MRFKLFQNFLKLPQNREINQQSSFCCIFNKCKASINLFVDVSNNFDLCTLNHPPSILLPFYPADLCAQGCRCFSFVPLSKQTNVTQPNNIANFDYYVTTQCIILITRRMWVTGVFLFMEKIELARLCEDANYSARTGGTISCN